MQGGGWKERLALKMRPNRYRHSLAVAEVARKLAGRWGAGVEQAELAGLAHDYARDLPAPELKSLALAHNLSSHPVELLAPVLLHAPVGAYLAEKELGLADREVLQAIARHTVGDPAMTLLDKVLFLADMIEPGRAFPGVEGIRKAAWEDLNAALLFSLENTLSHLLSRGGLIHPRAVEARNYLIIQAQGTRLGGD